MFDQDTGGAIRAPGRADLYLGVGEEPGHIAGQIKSTGQLYYLLLKPERVADYAAAPTSNAGVLGAGRMKKPRSGNRGASGGGSNGR